MTISLADTCLKSPVALLALLVNNIHTEEEVEGFKVLSLMDDMDNNR